MKFLLFPLFLAFAAHGFGQSQDPVNWSASYKPGTSTEGEVVITASIQKGWHTYSQRPTDAGPIPTSFTFTPSKDYTPIGNTVESDAHEEFVPAFDAKIFVFTDKADFAQKIKLNGKPGFPVTLKVEYMSCNDKMCLPPKTVTLTVKTL
jgi:hypothetical protein